MTQRRLRAADIGRLAEIEPAPQAPTWESDVASFLVGDGLATMLRRHRRLVSIAVVERDRRLVAACISYPDTRFDATRLAALLVDHRWRRSGVGGALFAAELRRIVAGGDSALWLVDERNEPMLLVARQFEPRPTEARLADGMVMFVAP